MKKFGIYQRDHAARRTCYDQDWTVTTAEKSSHKSLLKIKIIVKLDSIAILQVTIEVQHLVYVI